MPAAGFGACASGAIATCSAQRSFCLRPNSGTRLSQYQVTRYTFAQFKASFDTPRA
jgi:hypothetical protein